MTIMSIDASTKSTGVAIFENNTLMCYHLITASSTDLYKRIKKIVQGLQDILSKYSVDKIIAEEVLPPTHKEGIKNTQTHRALMYLQAAIYFMIQEHFPNAALEFTYPSSWRKCCGIKTGSGIKRASLKQADITFVNNHFNLNITSDDIADAIGIGYGYINSDRGQPKGELNWT